MDRAEKTRRDLTQSIDLRPNLGSLSHGSEEELRLFVAVVAGLRVHVQCACKIQSDSDSDRCPVDSD